MEEENVNLLDNADNNNPEQISRGKYFRRSFYKMEMFENYREKFTLNVTLFIFVITVVLMFVYSVILSISQIRSLEVVTITCLQSKNENTLPHDFINVTHTELYFQPNISESLFKGNITMEFEVLKGSFCLYFNSEDLTIENIIIHTYGEEFLFHKEKKEVVEIDSIVHLNESKISQIRLKDNLEVLKKYFIHISFTGYFREDLRGWYKSKIGIEGEENNVDDYIYSTHFECCSARTVFPFFDEPNYKTKFKISIEIPKYYETDLGFSLISNNEIKEKKNLENTFLYEFKETCKMSSYLVAFILGNVKKICSNNLKLCIYLTKKYSDSIETEAQFSLEVSEKVLETFSEYLGMDYFTDIGNITKLDIIGLPNFQAGAMENWGLITSREKYLITTNNSDIHSNLSTIQIITHEIAHQWFGNLITLKWWNDLYINEGFATFFEYFILTQIDKNYFKKYFTNGIEINIWELYMQKEFLVSMKRDSLKYSKSLSSSCFKVNEIESKFNYVSYNKGSIFLKMLYNYLGDDNFQIFIQEYLKKYKFLAITSDDLVKIIFDLFGESKNLTKSKIKSWIDLPGYPIIDIQLVNENTYVLKQERFLIPDDEDLYKYNDNDDNYDDKQPEEDEDDDDENEEELKKKIWWIPIKYFSSSIPKNEKTIDFFSKEINININSDWFKFNSNFEGYYKVNYPEEIWDKFIEIFKIIEHPNFSSFDYLNLLEDSYSLAYFGKINIKIGLKMSINYFSNPKRIIDLNQLKNNSIIFLTVAENLKYISKLLKDEPINSNFNIYIYNFIYLFFQLGGEEKEENNYLSFLNNFMFNDSEIYSDFIFLKQNLLELIILSENITMITTILDIFDSNNITNFKEIESKIPINYKHQIFNMIIKFNNINDDTKENILFDLFLKTKEIKYLEFLSYSKKLNILKKILKETITNPSIKQQDGIFIIIRILKNLYGKDLAWNWIRNNFDDILSKYGEEYINNYLIQYISKQYKSLVKYDELFNFFKEKDEIINQSLMKRSLQHIIHNMKFIEYNYNELEKYLNLM